MTRIFLRGPLTDWLLDYLEDRLAASDSALLLGDGIAPVEGGWTGGQPGKGEFRAYLVVSTGVVRHRDNDPLAGGDSSWLASYGLRGVGGSRQQADWAADQGREALNAARNIDLDLGGPWRMQQARYESLGGVSRNDNTDPPYWEVSDTVALWMDRT
jgi:hypothetical protein